jgi:MATE family multidrug resistance protein
MSLRRVFGISECRSILALGIPLAGSYLAEFALVFTVMLIVGRLGGVALGGTSLTIDVLYSILMFPTGILGMAAVFVAECNSTSSKTVLPLVIASSIYVLAILSILSVAAVWALPMLFSLLGQSEEVVSTSRLYLSGVFWGIPGVLFFVLMRQVLAALGSVRKATFVTLLAIGLNAVLASVLVLGLGDWGGLGVKGAGVATAIVAWVNALALVVIFLADFPDLATATLHSLAPSKRWLLKYAIVGIPAGLGAFFEYLGFVLIALMIGALSADSLAANQITFNFIFIISMISYGIGDAATIRITEALTKVQVFVARQVGRAALSISGAIVLSMGLLILLDTRAVIGLFIDLADAANQKTIEASINFLRIAALFQVFEGLQAVVTRLLRGYEDTRFSFYAACGGYWGFGILGGYSSSRWFGGDANDIWVMLTAGLCFMLIILSIRYASIGRKHTQDMGLSTEKA